MVVLLFQQAESEIQEVADTFTKAGIAPNTSMTYARALFAVQEDFEKLPQSSQFALLQALVDVAQDNPDNALIVSNYFQEKVQKILIELNRCQGTENNHSDKQN